MAYLREHPDFFERHTALLTELRVPHQAGEAVSLIERQVTALREQNQQLERRLMDLVGMARDNGALSSRLHRLALGLLEAQGLDDVLACTRDLLRDEFPATEVVVRLLGMGPAAAGLSEAHAMDEEVSERIFPRLFRSGRPLCGTLEREQVNCLFGEREIRSAVAVPLSDGRKLGVLALGSGDRDRFHQGMGTLFLENLGELVARAVKSHMLA
jgi:uncharacterized protein YigA (DUF484 family)